MDARSQTTQTPRVRHQVHLDYTTGTRLRGVLASPAGERFVAAAHAGVWLISTQDGLWVRRVFWAFGRRPTERGEVARVNHLPAVLGVDGATAIIRDIRDGERVGVEGERGVVRPLVGEHTRQKHV